MGADSNNLARRGASRRWSCRTRTWKMALAPIWRDWLSGISNVRWCRCRKAGKSMVA